MECEEFVEVDTEESVIIMKLDEYARSEVNK